MRLLEAMVPMRDGVRLATDVHLPDGAGPFPVILERTPYGRRETSRSEISAADPTPWDRARTAAFFAAHGYAVVYQDCRGRYGSEGAFVKYLSDGEDGFDCCAWIVAQPWCSGRIGTMGLSYAAHTQAALGCLDAPGLVAQMLDSGGFSNAWNSGIRQGGAFELKQATWAYRQALLAPETKADPVRRAALAAEDIAAWFTRMPWRAGHSPLRHAPDYEAYLLDQWRHGAFDDYWTKLGIHAAGWYGRYARVPMLHMSSWYDPYPRTAVENYLGLRARSPQSLILGPWTHGDRSVTFAGDVDFGPRATIDSWAGDWRSYRRRWFDHHVKGERNGIEAEPRARIFVMGGGSGRKREDGRLDHGGEWIEAADWPLPGTRFAEFHLHGDGGLREAVPAEGAAPVAWQHDPAQPVQTVGGPISSGDPVMAGGAYDQVEDPRWFGCRPPFLPLASRPDVAVFQTEPLERDVVLAGTVVLRAWIAADAPDCDLAAKLIDVHPPSADYPQGFAMNLTGSILRLRYRDDPAAPRLLEPGVPVEVTLELFPVANRFLRGHRIRIDLAGSNFPHFDVNPGTGEPEGLARRRQVVTTTLFVDAARPSRAVLPLLPGA